MRIPRQCPRVRITARKGDGSISFEHVPGTVCREARYHRRCRGRWRGIVDTGRDEQGRRRTRKVSGQSRAEAQARLDDLRAEQARGVRPRAGYTVADAVADWYQHELAGLAPKTASTYREVLDSLAALIGHKLLTDLSADDVRRTGELRRHPQQPRGREGHSALCGLRPGRDRRDRLRLRSAGAAVSRWPMTSNASAGSRETMRCRVPPRGSELKLSAARRGPGTWRWPGSWA